MGIEVVDIHLEAGQEPQDDYDDDFAVPIEADIVVSGRKLSRLLGVQERTLPRHLKKLTQKKALARISSGGPVSSEVLQHVRPKIWSVVQEMASEEFGHDSEIVSVDWGDVNDYWEAHVDSDEEEVRFHVFFDVIAEWV